jgi:hypothetical protein
MPLDENAPAALTFLSGMFADKPDNLFLLIWTRAKKESHWFKTTSEAASFAQRRTNDDVYFGVGLSPDPDLLLPVYQAEAEDAGKKPPKSTKEIRCRQADVVGIPAVWIDIDIADDIHKKSNLPPDTSAAISLLTQCPLEPTYLIHSGGGLQAYWQFDKLLTDHSRAIALAERWTDYFKQLAAPFGWDVDATQDLSRVMRVPGTFNVKGPEPRPVELLEGQGPRYKPADLEEHLVAAGVQSRSAAASKPKLTPSGKYLPEENKDFEKSLGSFVLDPMASYNSDLFDALAEVEPKFLASWNHKRRDLQDQSLSTFDFSLAIFAINAAWPDQEVLNLLVHHRRKWGDQKVDGRGQLRRDYYDRTIDRAKRAAEKTGSAAEIAELQAQEEIRPLRLVPRPEMGSKTDEQPPREKKERDRKKEPDDDPEAPEPPPVTPTMLLDQVNGALGLDIVAIKRVMTQPKYIRLDLKSGSIKLGDGSMLNNATKFRDKMTLEAKVQIPRFTPARWDVIAAKLTAAMEDEAPDPLETPSGACSYWLREYLNNRIPIDITDPDALEGHPFIWHNRVYITLGKFQEFLSNRKVSLKDYSDTLKAIKCEREKKDVPKGQDENGKATYYSLSAWYVPPEIYK